MPTIYIFALYFRNSSITRCVLCEERLIISSQEMVGWFVEPPKWLIRISTG